MKRTLKLIPGLPRERLFEEIYRHHRDSDASRRALGFYLLDMQRRYEQKAKGYSHALLFAVNDLKLSKREAREILRVARELEELAEIDEAFGRGEIVWSAMREITRVATAETEREWLAFARGKVVQEIERAVSASKRGDRPPRGGGLGTPRTNFRIQYIVPAQLSELWQVAIAKLMNELGEGATPLDALEAMAELVIRKDPDDNVKGRKDRSEPVYMVVYHASRDGRAAWVQSDEGPIPIPPEVVAEVAKKARVIEVKDIEDPGDTRAIRFGERGTVPPEERDPPASESLRAKIHARDGHRCIVCGSTRDLTDHHIKSRANGGKTVIEHMSALCPCCHGLLHDHLLLLRFDANGNLLILDKDGNPLKSVAGPVDRLKDSKNCPLTVTERGERGERTEESDTAPAPRGATGENDTLLDPRGATGGNDTLLDPRGASGGNGAPLNPRGASSLACLLALHSIDELPAALSAVEWRALQGFLEWSPQRRSFVVRPDRLLDGLPFDPRGHNGNGNPGTPASTAEQGKRRGGCPLRPEGMASFVGQTTAVASLEIAARAARERGEPLGHLILSGPAGLGKTTLAGILAREMGSELHTAVGSLVSDPHQFISLLAGLGSGDVFFIDEIHRLTPASQECLYTALEDGVVDAVVSDGSRVRTIRVVLEPFTLVGATTELGALSEPFRARFKLQERLGFYRDAELREVIERAAPRLGISVSSEAAQGLACRGRGTPREALRLFERARDLAQASRSREIELRHVERLAAQLGIDDDGLSSDDRRILECLIAHGRPLGIRTLAATLGLDAATIERVHEPYLLARGYLVRTPRGRAATRKARLRCCVPSSSSASPSPRWEGQPDRPQY